MMTVEVKNLADLKQFAARLVREFEPGDIIGLVGDLGAGKTTLVQMVAELLGVEKKVKSPTFVLMQAYETGAAGKVRGIQELCHVDAYRLKDEKELLQVGLDDYAGQRGVVTLIEWADRVPSYHRRQGYREVTISVGRDDARTIVLGARA